MEKKKKFWKLFSFTWFRKERHVSSENLFVGSVLLIKENKTSPEKFFPLA